jgi:DNA-binding response OmpR family regulator
MRKGDRDIVLVVDDSPETLRLLTDALEEAGMTVLVARAGEHALSIVEKVVPDVVLMDALMPGTDGFATCRKLKQNRALAHVPIIFMTGLSDTEDIIKGLEAGGVDYITKPIVPGEMLARIRVHLGNARMAHSARTALDAFGWRQAIPAASSGTRRRRQSFLALRSRILTARIMCCRATSRSGCKSRQRRRQDRNPPRSG